MRFLLLATLGAAFDVERWHLILVRRWRFPFQIRLTAASIAGHVTSAKTSIATAALPFWSCLFKRTQFPPIAIVVVDPTTCDMVATMARSFLIVATLACNCLTTEASASPHICCVITPAVAHVSSPHVAIRARLLELCFRVEVAVMIVDTTTCHYISRRQ